MGLRLKDKCLPRATIIGVVGYRHPPIDLAKVSLPERLAYWDGVLTAATVLITRQLSLGQLEKQALAELDELMPPKKV